MAQTTTISRKELERQAELVFEGRTLKIMLCDLTDQGYTSESTVAEWQSVEVVGNGYARFSQVIGTGSYEPSAGAYLLPEVLAAFTSTGSYSYNTVVLYIDGESYIHSLVEESPNIILSSGQTQTYAITLRQDD